jgi:hypothetical protein
MSEGEPLYVGIPEPTGLRKDLLNSSKDIITSLKKYDAFSSLRQEKAKQISEVLKLMKEIDSLNRKLKQAMPKTTVQPGIRKPEVPVSSRIIKEKTRLADLEQELARVEEKLGKIE